MPNVDDETTTLVLVVMVYVFVSFGVVVFFVLKNEDVVDDGLVSLSFPSSASSSSVGMPLHIY